MPVGYPTGVFLGLPDYRQPPAGPDDKEGRYAV